MRVVLSRKGFDSSYGGFPSPILPDGTLFSLPIPSPGDKIRYADLMYTDQLSYYEVMKQLKSTIKRPNRGRYSISKQSECHLDPDLHPQVLSRENDWRPLFGQINQAQSHLENQGISSGDLFLFFGWFKQTVWENGQLQFQRNAPNLHLIHGYLQIDEIIQPKTGDVVQEWMKYHPHVINLQRMQTPSNTLYVARKSLSWKETLPGGGVLNYDPDLVLTKEGETRSIWNLPEFFRDLDITYHSNKSWNKDGSYSSAKIGQEFVIEEDHRVNNWAASLIA